MFMVIVDPPVLLSLLAEYMSEISRVNVFMIKPCYYLIVLSDKVTDLLNGVEWLF